MSSKEQRRLAGSGASARDRMGRRWTASAVLIVANYDYKDPGLQHLRAPARDAEALARVRAIRRSAASRSRRS